MQKVNLNKDTQLLIDTFFKVKTKKILTSFVEDLFSPEETLDLAQRLKILDFPTQTWPKWWKLAKLVLGRKNVFRARVGGARKTKNFPFPFSP